MKISQVSLNVGNDNIEDIYLYDLYLDDPSKNSPDFELIDDKYITLADNEITYFLLDTFTGEILYQARNEFDGIKDVLILEK